MSSYCFICGGNSRPYDCPEGLKKLDELLPVLCKLVSGLELPPNWGFSKGDNRAEKLRSLICQSCFNVVVSMEELNTLLRKTQKSLRNYVHKVEGLILKSEAKQITSDLWIEPCLFIRESIILKAKCSNKETRSFYDDDALESHDDDTSWGIDWDDDLDLSSSDIPPTLEPIKKHSNSVKSKTEGKGRTASLRKSARVAQIITKPCSIVIEKLKPAKNTDHSSGVKQEKTVSGAPAPKSIKLARANKTKSWVTFEPLLDENSLLSEGNFIDAGFDLDWDAGNDIPSSPTAVIPKKSKTVAKASSKRKKGLRVSRKKRKRDSDDSDNSDSDFEPGDPLQSEEGEDQDGDDAGGGAVEKRKRPKKHDSEKSQKRFIPFVIAQEDLYLFNDTFVSRTSTHLKCLSDKCTFSVDFSYYTSFQEMKAHILTCHSDNKHRKRTPHYCLLCDEIFQTRKSFHKHLPLHVELHPKSKTNVVCECCLYSCTYTYIRAHMFKHKSEEEIAAAFASNDVPHSKRILERDRTERNFICTHEDCSAAFKHRANLNRHLQTHLARELRTDLTTCEECGVRIRFEKIKNHVEKFHHPERIHRANVCPDCGKRFLPGDVKAFQNHLRKHTGEKPFMCPDCGKTYFSRGSLNSHQNYVHKGSGLMKCEYCDQTFRKILTLRSHQRKMHLDLLPVNTNRAGPVSQFYANNSMEQRMRNIPENQVKASTSSMGNFGYIPDMQLADSYLKGEFNLIN